MTPMKEDISKEIMTEERQKQIIQEVLDMMDGGPKPTEADTCSRAIERLLRDIAGYGYADYHVQKEGEGETHPDYSMLHDTDYTWFLEAKAWRLPLSDRHAGQAVSYANNNGSRWVVLTNGVEWRLYDNAVHTGLTGKLVLTAKLSPPFDEILDFLSIISKGSMMSGQIVSVVDNIHLKRELDKQLSDSNSAVVKAIIKALKQIGLSNLTTQKIVEYFALKRDGHKPPAAEVEMPKTGIVPVTSTDEPQSSDSLAQLNNHTELVTGRKPVEVKFPDGRLKSVNNWKNLANEIIRWLALQNKLPQPPYPPNSRGWFFYSVANKHPNGKTMVAPFHLQLNGYALYVETKRSASNWIQNLYTLCQDSGVDTGQTIITINRG